MGVPKFYRWISERYPCLSETVKEYQIPEFDNLYLDMNGIIHVCSHPNDDDPHFRITEESIFKAIFHYIEVLFRMIQPREVFFMAIDGVAPRAKMNQQRGRRFRSAREAEENEKKALARGEELPKEARFDSNCITPGTEFMTKLDDQLQYFVTMKISTDPLWRNCQVIYSGHKTPGEGEHKIMEYIRYTKCQPNYNPHTRHCLYGLDADLIMLGLTSHEPHFSLLREEVRFDKKNSNKRTPTPEETTFHLLHLSLMRDYINLEFSRLHDVPFGYNLESIIDDWVFLGFLVGNDFIPHLPTMHINKDALPILYKTYMDVLPSLNGYLNEGGTLNLERFEKYMAKLTDYDKERFSEINDDLKYLKGKRGLRELEEFEFDEGTNENKFAALEQEGEDEKALTSAVAETLARLDIQPSEFSDDELDEEDTFEEEFRQHKRDYYMRKMEYETVRPEELKEQATNYVRGLQWILHYYYNGIASWSWYYPFHYAPYISDIKSFANVDMTFSKGTPFLPFEQLLAVLPPHSSSLLPSAFHSLLLSEESPLQEYYPKNFTTDLNGKQQEWEAVVLIPFINEERLLSEMEVHYRSLTPEEKSRNSHGPMYVYTYTAENLGEYKAPSYFPSISLNHASTNLIWRDDWDIDPSRFIKGLFPGVKSDVVFAGFPTLKHVDYTFRVAKEEVKVFQQNSRGENYILEITEKELAPLEDLANSCLGKNILVNWPHLMEAKLTALTDGKFRYNFNDDSTVTCQPEETDFKHPYNLQRANLAERLLKRWGIDTKDIKILAFAKILSGRKYAPTANGKVTLEKEWSDLEQPFPFQTILLNMPVHQSSYKQYMELQSYFSPGSKVFMLGQPCYGSMGEVIGSDSDTKGRIRVTMIAPQEPNFEPVYFFKDNNVNRYMTGYEAATRLSISPHLFARLSGTILLAPPTEKNPFQELEKTNYSKINIGLNLKSKVRQEQVMGFTRQHRERDKDIWLYSEKCVEALREYQEKFPEIFNFLSHGNVSNDVYYEDKIFPNNYKERVPELVKWIKGSTFHSAERCPIGSHFLEPEVIAKIKEEVENARNLRAKTIRMQVKPHLLYKPNPYQGSLPPDKTVKFELFDRVVNVREGFSVPLGAKGTLVGFQPREKEIGYLYDVLFDEPFIDGLTLYGPSSAKCCYRLHWASLINISHGERQSSPSYKVGRSGQSLKQSRSYIQSSPSYAKSSPGGYQPNGSYNPGHPQPNSYSNNPSGSHMSNSPSYLQHKATSNESSATPLTRDRPYDLGSNQSYSDRKNNVDMYHSLPHQSHGSSQAPIPTVQQSPFGFTPPPVSTTAKANFPPDPALLPSPVFKNVQNPGYISPRKSLNQTINITKKEDVPFVLHGNFFHNWQAIQRKGLKKDDRREYVPCLAYLPKPIGLKSYQLHIYLDLAKLLRDNFHLKLLSENQVLCSTNTQGYIPPYYFEKVVDTQSGRVIFQPGMDNILSTSIPPSHGESLGKGKGHQVAPFKPPQNTALLLHQTIWSQVQSEGVNPPSSKEFVREKLGLTQLSSPSTESSEPKLFPETLPASPDARKGITSTSPVCINKDVSPSLQESSSSSKFVPIQVIRNKTPRKSVSEDSVPAPSASLTSAPPACIEESSPVPPKSAETKKSKPKKVVKNRLAVNFGALKEPIQ